VTREVLQRLWTRLTTRITTGRFRRRLVDWLILGVLVTTSVVWHEVAYSRDIIKEFFGAKLTIIALVVATGTFQYEVFHRILNTYETWLSNHLNDRRWLEYFQRAEAVPESERTPAFIEELEANRKRFGEHAATLRAHIREGLIEHNFAVLSNLFAVGLSIFASVIADAAVLLREDDASTLRATSTGALFFSAIPFAALLIRYIYVLVGEEREYYKHFAEPPQTGAP
jgi:hypothetical protein